MIANNYAVVCSVNPARSYPGVPASQSDTVSVVATASCCSGYGASGPCGLDPACEWCDSCSGVTYSGGVSRCVMNGTCAYDCSTICGAACDAFTVGSCDDTCFGAVTLTQGESFVCAGCTSSCVGGVNTPCAPSACSSVYPNTVGGCANTCLVLVGDDVCSSCVPTYTGIPLIDDCVCAPGYEDNDGILVNGCEYGCTASGVDICDNLDNDCNGVIDDNCDLDNDSYANESMTCVAQFLDGNGVVQSCALNGGNVDGDCDDGNVTIYPGAPEVCNGVDNNCNAVVDENVGTCYHDPSCDGVLDCNAEFDDDGTCDVALGCSEVPGQCDDTNVLCDTAHPCATGTCVGLDCSGLPSCKGFSDANCTSNENTDYPTAYGCTLSTCGNAIARTELVPTGTLTCTEVGIGCNWTCGVETYSEICSDGVDNDGDGDVDCMDTDCQVNATGETNITGLICLGTDHYTSSDNLSAIAGTQWQCGQGLDSGDNPVQGVGLCCVEGEFPRVDGFGVWNCGTTSACLAPQGSCGANYTSSTFDIWRTDSDCLDVSTPSACCNVVQFGQFDYWSDEGNVVIY